MADQTSISNRALQRLGAQRLTNFTDDTRNGRACQACYDSIQDMELRKHPWCFAIARAVLAADAQAPAYGYAYRFLLPADYIRMVRELDPFCDWQLEGQYILTNFSDPVQLRYVGRVTDPNVWDPLFRELVSHRMAEEMCEELTQSTSKLQSIQQDVMDIMTEARKANAFEKIPAVGEDGSWVLSRLVGVQL